MQHWPFGPPVESDRLGAILAGDLRRAGELVVEILVVGLPPARSGGASARRDVVSPFEFPLRARSRRSSSCQRIASSLAMP